MDIIKFFVSLAHALNPGVADTPDQLYTWRQTVAALMVALVLVVGFDTAQGHGWLGWAGVSGYVTSAQFGDLSSLVRQSREDQLVNEIGQQMRRYCQAFEAGDSEGMQFAWDAVQEARGKYFKLTKREYPQLMCSMSAQPAKAP